MSCCFVLITPTAVIERHLELINPKSVGKLVAMFYIIWKNNHTMEQIIRCVLEDN